MCVAITWELPSIVYCEVRSTIVLQLFRSGTDTPATTQLFVRSKLNIYFTHTVYFPSCIFPKYFLIAEIFIHTTEYEDPY